MPQGQLPGRTSAPRTSAGPNKFPQLSTSIQKRSGTDMYNCSRLKAICSVMQIQCNSNFASLPCKLNCQFMRSQYKVTNSLNHQDYHQLLLKHHHNLQQPLASKSVTTPYEIGTCSYDPYTNLNHQDYHQLLLKHHHNLQQPLASKSVNTPYEIGTCSHDPYTKLNLKDYHQLLLNTQSQSTVTISLQKCHHPV